MGVLVGLLLGLGLLSIWSASTGEWVRVDRGPGRVARTLDQAGIAGLSASGLGGLSLAVAFVVGLAAQAISGTAPVAVAFAVIAGYLPYAGVAGRARRRRRELAEVWPEAIDHLASGVRAGLSLPDALAALAHRGPEPLREAFAAFALDYQSSGRFGDALDRLKARLADPVGDRVVEGLRVAREVGGGDLGRLLRNLSGYLRDDLRTRSEMESRQSWTVNTVRSEILLPKRDPEVAPVVRMSAWQDHRAPSKHAVLQPEQPGARPNRPLRPESSIRTADRRHRATETLRAVSPQLAA